MRTKDEHRDAMLGARPEQSPEEYAQVSGEAEEARDKALAQGHGFPSDHSPFANWLRAQTKRRDPVGRLARVAVKDPVWPGSQTRKQVADYLTSMGAREFVMRSVKSAWDEFERHQQVSANRAKSKAARQARKRNRRKR